MKPDKIDLLEIFYIRRITKLTVELNRLKAKLASLQQFDKESQAMLKKRKFK